MHTLFYSKFINSFNAYSESVILLIVRKLKTEIISELHLHLVNSYYIR